jgi:hypothetical protein
MDSWTTFTRFAAVVGCAGTLCAGAVFAFECAQSWQKRFDSIDAGIAQINQTLTTTVRSQLIDEQAIEVLKDKSAQHDTSIATTAETLRSIGETTRTMSGQVSELYSYLLRNRHAGADKTEHQTASSDR